MWPPRSSDLRIQELTGNGEELSKPDDVHAALRAGGYVGSIDDMWKQHLEALGITSTAEPFTTSIAIASWDAETVFVGFFNGANGATAATEETERHTIGFGGTAHLDTTIKKFGTASVQFDGNSDYVTGLGNLTDFEFAAGNFTMECHAYAISESGSQAYLNISDSATDRAVQIVNINGTLYCQWSTNGTAWSFHSFGDAGMSTATWYHIALVRNGTALTMYVDGSSIGSADDWTGVTIHDVEAATLSIGAADVNGTPTQFMNGYIDNVRITKGLARYTANFTAPTAEYES